MYVSSYSICIFLILTLDNHIRMIKKTHCLISKEKKIRKLKEKKIMQQPNASGKSKRKNTDPYKSITASNFVNRFSALFRTIECPHCNSFLLHVMQ